MQSKHSTMKTLSFFTMLKIESYSIVYYEVMQYEKSLETLCYLFRCD